MFVSSVRSQREVFGKPISTLFIDLDHELDVMRMSSLHRLREISVLGVSMCVLRRHSVHSTVSSVAWLARLTLALAPEASCGAVAALGSSPDGWDGSPWQASEHENSQSWLCSAGNAAPRAAAASRATAADAGCPPHPPRPGCLQEPAECVLPLVPASAFRRSAGGASALVS